MSRTLIAGLAAGLASISIGVSTAGAQGGGQQQPVTISFQTPPTRTITVVTFGTTGIVSTATAGKTPGTFVLPGRDFNNGKSVEIWTVTCKDTRQVGVMDPTVALPTGCEKRRDLGKGIWAPGATLQAVFPPRPGGIRFNPYALGGMNFTYTSGLADVSSDLDDFFTDVGLNSSTTTDALDFGYQFGGGVRMSWSRKIPAIDVSFLYSNVGGPSLDTTGTDPLLPGVSLNLESQLAYTMSSLRFGAKFKVLPQLYVTPMASYNWWKVNLDSRLRILDGNQVLFDDTMDLETSGSDWGFGARVDYKLPQKLPIKIYGEVMINLIRANDFNIYGNQALPPWSPDHNLIVTSVGIKYDLPFRWRIGGNVQ